MSEYRLMARTPPCVVCGKASEVEVWSDEYSMWIWGLLPAQCAFPGLSVDQRELLISGTHAEYFDILYPSEEE